MRANTTAKQSSKRMQRRAQSLMTIGLDTGDKISRYCLLDENGDVQSEGSVATTRKAMAERFAFLSRPKGLRPS